MYHVMDILFKYIPMEKITSKLKEHELSKVQTLIEGKQDLINTFYSAIEQVPYETVSHNPFRNYDAKFFGKFLEHFVAKKLSKHTEGVDIHALVVDGDISPQKLLESMGAKGISEVIRVFIEKMIETNSISESQIGELVELVEARNELENEEIAYINDSYKDYLHTQISMQKLMQK